jgi:hypothetical protein
VPERTRRGQQKTPHPMFSIKAPHDSFSHWALSSNSPPPKSAPGCIVVNIAKTRCNSAILALKLDRRKCRSQLRRQVFAPFSLDGTQAVRFKTQTPFGMQRYNLLTKSEIFKDEVFSRTESTDSPSQEMSERHDYDQDHGQNLIETRRIRSPPTHSL